MPSWFFIDAGTRLSTALSQRLTNNDATDSTRASRPAASRRSRPRRYASADAPLSPAADKQRRRRRAARGAAGGQPPLEAAQIRLGGRRVLLGREQQRDV